MWEKKKQIIPPNAPVEMEIEEEPPQPTTQQRSLPVPKELPKLVKRAVEEEKEEEIPNRVLVVKELPTQTIRKIQTDNGEIIDLITIEEALSELMTGYRRGE